MNHEIYVFGSIIRGEVSSTSDVDVLVIALEKQAKGNYPPGWSVYSPEVIETHYRSGRLFAWHLHLESVCLYTPSQQSFLSSLGPPEPYCTYNEDIDDLAGLLKESISALRNGSKSSIYEIGLVHTASRDIAMAASWRLLGAPVFSRDAPFKLPIEFPLTRETYDSTILARHHSTRGVSIKLEVDQIKQQLLAADFDGWINSIRRAL